MTLTEKTGEPAAPLLLPPIRSSETCYGVPAVTFSVAVFHDHYIPEYPAYVLLPVFLRRPRGCGCFRRVGSIISSSALLFGAFLVVVLLLSAAFFIWPSDPELPVARLHLDHIHVTARSEVDLDISMDVELRIHDPAFFALDYRCIVVSIGYRGRQLGSVAARGGRIRARGVSLVHDELKLNRIRFPKDVYLIQDLARGSLPLDTVTLGVGKMQLLFFEVPVKKPRESFIKTVTLRNYRLIDLYSRR